MEADNAKLKIAALSSPELQEFVFTHEHDDERELVLKSQWLLEVPSRWIAEQLSGRRKARTKLPRWYSTRGIAYPPMLNLEQSSSEATALFKQRIVLGIFPAAKILTGADLTGGLGVDSYFLSACCTTLHYAEPDENTLGFAQHNHRVLGSGVIHYHQTTAEAFLEQHHEPLDFIFLDPSRRNESQKVFRLAQCVPDVVALHDRLLKRTENVIIKCSPMLDLTQGLSELRQVRKIWIVSVGNECKEVLFWLARNFSGEPDIEAVELANDGTVKDLFLFQRPEEEESESYDATPQRYLYEPNAAVLKSGAFKLVGGRFGLAKLAASTHLFTSDHLIHAFPGRVFEILQVQVDEKTLQALPQRKANVMTRNHPLSAEALKKKLRVQDGGDYFVIGYSSARQKFISLATRVK